MSVYNGIAAIGDLGFDVVCGVPGLDSGINGGGFDYVTIPDGQCDYPVGSSTAVVTKSADRYCGTALKYFFFKHLCHFGVSCAQVLPNPMGAAGIAGTPANTVCTNLRPFKIGVHSDSLEYSMSTLLFASFTLTTIYLKAFLLLMLKEVSQTIEDS